MAHILKTLSVVALLASTTTATLALGSHSGGGTGSGKIVPYEYLRYCSQSSSTHDSSESFVTVPSSNGVKSTTAAVLTTAAQGESLPYALIRSPQTPAFVSLEADVLGRDNNSFGNVLFANTNGLFDAGFYELNNSQKTKPLATTPSGYTHYRLTTGNADEYDGPTPNNNATFLEGSFGEFPSNNSHTLSVANVALNSTFGAPNATLVTSASVIDCENIDLP